MSLILNTNLCWTLTNCVIQLMSSLLYVSPKCLPECDKYFKGHCIEWIFHEIFPYGTRFRPSFCQDEFYDVRHKKCILIKNASSAWISFRSHFRNSGDVIKKESDDKQKRWEEIKIEGIVFCYRRPMLR